MPLWPYTRAAKMSLDWMILKMLSVEFDQCEWHQCDASFCIFVFAFSLPAFKYPTNTFSIFWESLPRPGLVRASMEFALRG